MKEFEEPKYSSFLKRPLSKILIVVGLLLGFIIVAGAWWFFSIYAPLYDDVENILEEEAGILLMSLSHSDEQISYTKQHMLQLGDVTALPVQVDSRFLFAAEPDNVFAPNFFFAVTTSDFTKTNYPENPIQVHKISSDRTSATPILGAEGFFQRSLAYNDPADRLAYMYQAEAGVDSEVSTTVADWNVKILSKASTSVPAQDVLSAAHPQWSPEGDYLFYLGEFGLMYFDIEQGTNVVLWELDSTTESSLQIGSSIAVSRDGQEIVWTTPDDGGRLDLFSVLYHSASSTGPVVELVRTFEESGYHYSSPVISPDGMKVALIATGVGGQEIQIKSLVSGEILQTYLLDGFDTERLFLDSWIQYDF